jgi:hypothetical protein
MWDDGQLDAGTVAPLVGYSSAGAAHFPIGTCSRAGERIFMKVFEARERARRYLREMSPWLV